MMKGPKPDRTEWMSLEQTAAELGVPWLTVWRWARNGDPRLPAFTIWEEGTRDQASYRFRKADVEALQERLQAAAHGEEAVDQAVSAAPSPPG
jgi:hypothetical protein